jgi:AcrR family transcriptional regulator
MPSQGRTTADRRAAILDAAMALADERGLDAVTMRAVAERVGVTPMALYPHVGDKQALLDGLLGRLLAEIALPDPAAPWRDRLVALAHGLRATGQRHPAVFPLLLARPSVTTGALRVVEAIYAALREAGVPDPQVPRVERLLSTFVIGYLASQANGRFGPGSSAPRQRRTQVPADELPVHHALAPHLDLEVDWDAEFDADLDDMLRMVSAIAARGPAGGPVS